MGEKYRFVYKHFRPAAVQDSVPVSPIGPESVLMTDRYNRWDAFFAFHYTRGKSKWTPAVRGGLTACYIYGLDGVVATGLAKCSPLDAFRYGLGREIAKGRALKALNEKSA